MQKWIYTMFLFTTEKYMPRQFHAAVGKQPLDAADDDFTACGQL